MTNVRTDGWNISNILHLNHKADLPGPPDCKALATFFYKLRRHKHSLSNLLHRLMQEYSGVPCPLALSYSIARI
jgi:hypothetical protein